MKVSLTFLIITQTHSQTLEILENTEKCEENKNHVYSDPAESHCQTLETFSQHFFYAHTHTHTNIQHLFS